MSLVSAELPLPRIYNRWVDTDIPATAVLVDRTTPFGNPFKASIWGQAGAVVKFREWINEPEQTELRALGVEHLRGRDLICWCWPQRCHAEVWREIANN